MNDIEFNKLWSSLNNLQTLGCYVVIFRISEEKKIRQGIFERYGAREDGKVFLRNINLIFI